jgi:hypothetical protein
MSVIKQGAYNYNDKPLILLHRNLLIDTGHTAEQQRARLIDSIDVLLDEVSGQINTTKAMAAMMDVAQTMSGYLLAHKREEHPSINPVEWVRNQVDIASTIHIQRYKLRAAERNWTVMSE